MLIKPGAHILVTGGTGYIGSHVCGVLLEQGYQVTVLDNLSNSQATVLDRLEAIFQQRPEFIRGDIRDAKLLAEIFAAKRYQAVMHFAGLKAVGESVAQPLEYYDNNVHGSMVLLNAMQTGNVRRLIFSSSATVYGDPSCCPIQEDFPRTATNPYGRSKLIIEDILSDLKCADPSWQIVSLRYFNPIGAHESGQLGEDPAGIPNNLVPYLVQVAMGHLDKLSIFGNDYPTRDGTGVRDYIHVMDLAEGHVAALQILQDSTAMYGINLGTGQGYSVLEILQTFERVIGKTIPYTITKRRPGDIAECWADVDRAKNILGWQARRDLACMCSDHWRWQYNNPHGYKS